VTLRYVKRRSDRGQHLPDSLLDRIIGQERPCLLIQEPLRRVDQGIWVVDGVQRLRVGLREPVRMTAVRLGDGSVVAHSPLPPTPETRAAIDAIGPVRWIVAPNLYHHLHVTQALAAWPAARLLAVRGLAAKRPGLSIAGELPEAAPRDWAPELEVLEVGPLWGGFREILLFHRPTRTLLVTDLAFYIADAATWIERWIWRLNGVYRKLGPTLLFRLGALREVERAAGSLLRVLDFDFERIIVAHGAILETGGRAAFERAFAGVYASLRRAR